MLCFIGGRKDQWSVESHNEYYIYVIHYYYMPEGFKLQLQLHYKIVDKSGFNCNFEAIAETT